MKENVTISTALYEPREIILHQMIVNGKMFSPVHLDALYLHLFQYPNNKGEAINALEIQFADWFDEWNYVLDEKIASIEFKDIGNHDLLQMLQDRFEETGEMLSFTDDAVILGIPQEFIINNTATLHKDAFDFDAFVKSLNEMILNCWSMSSKPSERLSK